MPNAELFFFFFLIIYLFIYLFMTVWVFLSVRGLSPVAASGGHSSSRCAGLSLSGPLLLRNTGSRCAGSVVVAHGPSCSAACGILPDQGSNLRPLPQQADSQPLSHQGSPNAELLCKFSGPSSVTGGRHNPPKVYLWAVDDSTHVKCLYAAWHISTH